MYANSAAIQGWLGLQVQSLGNCPYALLVAISAGAEPQLVAHWPAEQPASPGLESAVAKLVTGLVAKQRLQMEKLSEEELLVGLPVMLAGDLCGAFICCLPAQDKTHLPLALKKLQAGLTWLQLILLAQTEDKRLPAHSSDKTTEDSRLLLSLRQLMDETSLRELAISLVNYVATQLQATRVCLGLQHPELQLEAVSFSASYDARTAPMRAILNSMGEAIEQGRNLSCSANGHQAQGVHLCHQQLLQDNRLQLVTTLILDVRKKQQDSRLPPSIAGALTIEHSELIQLRDEQWQFVQRLLELVAPLLQLKMAAEAGLMQQAKVRGRHWLGQRLGEKQLARKLLLGATAVFLVSLCLPVRYEVRSEAVLQGAYKNVLVAPQDGYLALIKVRPGDAVKQGDLLAQLKDDELYLERRKLASQQQQYQQEYDNALANANRVQAAIANAQVDQASAQLQLIEQELGRTQLLAPVAGIVVSDDISQSLGAPVKQGQVLFEIAAATDFIVQIFVDERDITSIAIGQVGNLKLASLPGEKFSFKVSAITPISQIKEGRNYFRVEAKLDKESQLLRPGMTGSARTAGERRLLGWIWFHDIWHWLRITFWW